MKNAYEDRSRGELASLRRSLSNARVAHMRESDRLHAEIRRVEKALKTAYRENIAVSDHATLRWLERVHGIDMGAVRAEVIQAVNSLDGIGDARIIDGPGYRICMEENRVLTVLPLPAEDYMQTSQDTAREGVGEAEARTTTIPHLTSEQGRVIEP